ncbi:MAG: hypothetical protein ACI9WC_003096 [Arenicella sp.]|jgi:hypothetical protein
MELSRRMGSVEYIEEFSDESLSIYDVGGFSSSTEREVLHRQSLVCCTMPSISCFFNAVEFYS